MTRKWYRIQVCFPEHETRRSFGYRIYLLVNARTNCLNCRIDWKSVQAILHTNRCHWFRKKSQNRVTSDFHLRRPIAVAVLDFLLRETFLLSNNLKIPDIYMTHKIIYKYFILLHCEVKNFPKVLNDNLNISKKRKKGKLSVTETRHRDTSFDTALRGDEPMKRNLSVLVW